MANRAFRVFRRTECVANPGVIVGLTESMGIIDTPVGKIPNEKRHFMYLLESPLKPGDTVELPAENLIESERTFVNDDGEEKKSNWLYWNK